MKKVFLAILALCLLMAGAALAEDDADAPQVFPLARDLIRPTAYMELTEIDNARTFKDDTVTSVFRFVGKNEETGKDLLEKYVAGLQQDGYTVVKSRNIYHVSLEDQLLADIGASGSRLTVTFTLPLADLIKTEAWISPDNIRIEFGEDGKGTYVRKAITYSVSGDEITYYYPAGEPNERRYTLFVQEKDGFIYLSRQMFETFENGSFFMTSQIDAIRDKANKGMKPEQKKFGERIEIGDLQFTVKDAKSYHLINPSNGISTNFSSDGVNPLLTFVGTVKNNGENIIDLSKIGAFCSFGDDAFIPASFTVMVEYNNAFLSYLPPKASGTLYIIHGALSEERRAALSGATLTLSFSKDLVTKPIFPGNGKYIYQWKLSAARAKTAGELSYCLSYIDSIPDLPMPNSFMFVSNFSSTREVRGGKVRSSLLFDSDGKTGSQMLASYRAGLEQAGLTLRKSKAGYRVYLKDTELAEISADGDHLAISSTGTIAAQLTGEPWMSPERASIEFGAKGKGTVYGYAPMSYKLSGNKVTFTYPDDQPWKQTYTMYMLSQDGFLYLSPKKDGDITTGKWFMSSQIDAFVAWASKDMKPVQKKFGEKANLGSGVTITLKDIRRYTSIQGTRGEGQWMFGSTPYLTFTGTVENTGKKEVSLSNIAGSFTYQGSLATPIYQVYADIGGQLVDTLPPQSKGTLLIVTTMLNDEDVQYLNGAVLLLSVSKGFQEKPLLPAFGSSVYQWKISAQRAEGAAKKDRIVARFVQQTKLVIPSTYVPCYKKSVSATRGKGELSYRISFASTEGEPAETVVDAYVKGLKEDGFTVRKAKNIYRVSLEDTELAQISTSGEDMFVSFSVKAKRLKKTYFAESPKLPRPDSYLQYKEVTTYIDGKTTYYNFFGFDNDKSKDLYDNYLKKLKEDGFTVKSYGKDNAEIYLKNQYIGQTYYNSEQNEMILYVKTGQK